VNSPHLQLVFACGVGNVSDEDGALRIIVAVLHLHPPLFPRSRKKCSLHFETDFSLRLAGPQMAQGKHSPRGAQHTRRHSFLRVVACHESGSR